MGRLTLPSGNDRGRWPRTDGTFRDDRRRGLRDLGRWPFRVGICATLAVLTGLAALAQREALAPPRWGVVVLVAIAVLPWLVDLLIAVPPPWAFAGAVVLPVALLHDPVGFDPLPLLLAILALDLGLQVGPRRSLIVLAPGVVVALGPALATAGLTRALVAVLAAVGGGWLVGLALHSQVARVARLRARLRHVEAELAQARAELTQARRPAPSVVEADGDGHRAH